MKSACGLGEGRSRFAGVCATLGGWAGIVVGGPHGSQRDSHRELEVAILDGPRRSSDQIVSELVRETAGARPSGDSLVRHRALQQRSPGLDAAGQATLTNPVGWANLDPTISHRLEKPLPVRTLGFRPPRQIPRPSRASSNTGVTRAIYLDYNASAPLDPRVADTMVSALTNVGNAASAHGFGRRQAVLVDDARERVGDLVGSPASNVVFTASATEANNLALQGVARQTRTDRHRLLVSAIEHDSVFRTAEWLRDRGDSEVDVIPVTPGGSVDLDALKLLLGPDVLLVSVMAANGETGVLNPIAEVAELARASGSLFHCDATQFVGRMPMCARDVGADLVSVSGHKLGGPMGTGALIGTRRALAGLEPVIHGGSHERGLRSGSLNVPGIVGFGEAAAIAVDERVQEAIRMTQLRDRLTDSLMAALPGVTQIGDVLRRLPNTACVRFTDADAEAVTANLEPVAVSTGSACSAGSVEPSHVLIAMGLSRSAAFECVRFSLGRSTTDTDIEVAVASAVKAVQYVREMTASSA